MVNEKTQRRDYFLFQLRRQHPELLAALKQYVPSTFRGRGKNREEVFHATKVCFMGERTDLMPLDKHLRMCGIHPFFTGDRTLVVDFS